MRFSTIKFATALLAVSRAIASPTGSSSDICSLKPATDPSIRIILTEDAPIPGSPISQAVVSGDHIYVSGLLPLAPHTDKIVGDDIDSQTLAVLDNCKAVIEAAGSHLGKVVKVNLYLKNITDYERVNEIYREFFGTHKPARTAVAVAGIPLDLLIELDMTARL